jgi:hypothetical protein
MRLTDLAARAKITKQSMGDHMGAWSRRVGAARIEQLREELRRVLEEPGTR